MTIEIRQIREEDIDAYYAALSVVINERRYLAFASPPPIEQIRTFCRRNIERGNPQFVAVVDGSIAGWCDIFPLERDTMAHVGVLGIALTPEYRGKGLGERLMREAIAAGWRYGFHRIELGVYTHNVRAKSLYDKLGFVEEGVRRHRVRMGDQFLDEIIMALFAD
jgi:RimJ/RimL family protein N-acetyltransferase